MDFITSVSCNFYTQNKELMQVYFMEKKQLYRSLDF
ncbi:hypothetical protein AsAng_0040810 [Aureispira anguillae]|uniref:Uncharacterized protein n=1 Tax=Aureispira anguillae TaxID=2864201 RepID=A0A916DTL7_9BACT|nr:hypothetical protein AsAng_0040810 [Aureispira anguillae]